MQTGAPSAVTVSGEARHTHPLPALPDPSRDDRTVRHHSPAPARLLAVITTLVLALSLAACSKGEESSPSPGADSSSSPTATPEEPSLPQGLQRSTVEIGQVAGSLSRRQRKRLVADVGGLVDRWFERAWLAAPLGRRATPFPGFTPAATQRARQQRKVTTVRGVEARLGGVVPRTRGIRLDVLAPGGTPQAVTARIHLGLAAYDRELERLDGRVVVTGRLMLAPVGKRWRVFGYDVATSQPGKAGKKQAGKKQAGKKQAGKKQAGKQKPGTKKTGKQKPGKKKDRKGARR